ncbi:esterase/lipase-like protein [Asticcacaulis biprosthecium C19]|uniref:Esterase/lipase-like protein n=1 Tax=Asticcacaulis biprosthecium C19 TaxID=715226 RepID=F4QTH8_9CAUL|nr:alpha/beta hydrolase [Asticcacaulis biprosthecium]EGF90048.1 esterase/lipase-like protein [Asticcacaulis biprosthecium C19]
MKHVSDIGRWCAGLAGALALMCLAASPGLAQDSKMVAIESPAQPGAIPLNTGALPGATAPESWHRQYGSVFARNVTEATLTPFLPDPAKATGAAVIIAPGGGFRTLSMENEGWDMARQMADRGVAAFVLKYRLNQTPASLEEFSRPAGPPPSASSPSRPWIVSADSPQIADVNAAFALVRANAATWGVDADRIGMVGFSAGARLTLWTTLQSAEAKPAFIGYVYAPLTAVEVPADAPPMFVALAADDPLIAPDFGLIDSWRKAKRPVELHLYEQGGHGFGMYQKKTTSTGWFGAFVNWIDMHGFLARKP